MLGIEVEIVDDELNILGGTGAYQYKIGQKEENGDLESDYLYARVLRTGTTQYVADAKKKRITMLRERDDSLRGAAEICTPIVLKGKTIGIIGLVAFDEKQKKILSDKNKNMIVFVGKDG